MVDMENLGLASPSADRLSFSESAYNSDLDEALNDTEIEELMREVTLKAKAMAEKQEERNEAQERISEMWNRISEGIRGDLERRKEIREMSNEALERIEQLHEQINDVQDGMRDIQEGIRDVLAAINGESKAKQRADRKVPIEQRSNSSMQAEPSGIWETHGRFMPEGTDRAAVEETLYAAADDSTPAYEAKAQRPPRARANSV